MDVILVYLFLVGLFLGSFYNVVAERISREESIIKPGSHCDNCKHRLTWYELIPVFSFIFLKGKCRVCHIKLSKQYLIIEIITGLLFSLSYYIFGISYKTLLLIVLFSVAIITFITDFKYYLILDEVIITGSIFVIVLYLIFDRGSILNYIISGIVMFLIMLLIKVLGDKAFKTESLGWGDVKLSVLAGLVLGVKMGLVYIFLGSVLALVPALIVSRKNNEHIIPFGPFLMTSIIIIFINMDFFIKVLNMITGG